MVGCRTVCGRSVSQQAMVSFKDAPSASASRATIALKQSWPTARAGRSTPVQDFDSKRIVAVGPRHDREKIEDVFEPARDRRVVVRFDLLRKDSAAMAAVVFEAAYAGINQTDHVLRPEGSVLPRFSSS